jgi:hypothetical protein
MKGLDTPVLLSILHDSGVAKELLKSLRGEELATTEVNLYELELLSALGARAQRAPRQTALARLRRRITVLPITPEATREAARLLRGKPPMHDYRPLIWGTLAAAGCAEWLTTRGHAPPKQGMPFRVKIVL